MVDIVIAVTVIEAIALALLRRMRLLPTVAAGLLLLVAMRLALADGPIPAVGACLLGAGLAHGVDVVRRR